MRLYGAGGYVYRDAVVAIVVFKVQLTHEAGIREIICWRDNTVRVVLEAHPTIVARKDACSITASGTTYAQTGI